MPRLGYLADIPEIVKSLDPEQNGAIDPRCIRLGSGKKLWWRCLNGPDHAWEAPVYRRVRSAGCPFCIGARVSVTNRLSTVAPGLALDWHPTKTGKLTPDDVTKGSGRPVWWRCTEGRDHVWRARVSKRTGENVGCPFCANHRTSVTNRLRLLDPERNGGMHSSAQTPRPVCADTTHAPKPEPNRAVPGQRFRVRIHGSRWSTCASCPERMTRSRPR